MFSLFNKVKTEDVYNQIKTKMLWYQTKGIPEKSCRTSDNYVVSPYSYCEKDKCGFSIKTKKDGLRLEFSFSFNKKDKESTFKVWVYDLDLSISKDGMRMIKEKYPQFNFSFLTATIVNYPTRKCKSVMDCFYYLQDAMGAWNSCDLYNLLVDLNKTLKK